MSQENVEITRRWVEAYNARDMEVLLRLTTSDYEFRSIFVSVESVFRAPDGFPFEYFKTLGEAYESFVVNPSELVDAGAAVLLAGTADWRGRASGAEGKTPIFTASWLRAGRLFRSETFTDRGESLEAIGLQE